MRDPHAGSLAADSRAAQPAVITVGTFDGLHRGHLGLLARLRAKAEELRLPSTLVTFEPHPLEVLRPESAPGLLTTPPEKLEILAQTGLDRVIFLRFDRRLAAYEPRRFVEEVLLARLGMCHLVIGHDHGFGRNRTGDAALLRELGGRAGFGLDVVGPVLLDGKPISSSRVRRALERGDVAAAAAELGRPYTLTGVVGRGEGRGRRLGFPTANIALPDPRKLIPLDGIYVVYGELEDMRRFGLLHIGPRPTFDDARPAIEFFAFDFDGDVYGQRVRITFCERIRGIERFASESELVRAMESDRAAAERCLAAGGGACASIAAQLE